jgi:hypothetical protein
MLTIDDEAGFAEATSKQIPALCEPYIFHRGDGTATAACYVVHRPSRSDVAWRAGYCACGCTECGKRFVKLHSITGRANVPLLLHSPSDHVDTAFHSAALEQQEACSREPVDMVFVSSDTKTLFGMPPTAGGYSHFVVPVTNVPDGLTPAAARVAEAAVRKYVLRSTFFQDVLARTYAQGKGSVALLLECLEEISYDSTAVKWLQNVLEAVPTLVAFHSLTPTQKIVFQAEFLLKARVSSVRGVATCPLLHFLQKGVLPILESADTRQEMHAMVVATLSPGSDFKLVKKGGRRVRTGTGTGTTPPPPSTWTSLGDFVNSVARMEDLLRVLPPTAVTTHRCFSGEARPMSLEERVVLSSIKTLYALQAYMTTHPDMRVEICVGTGPEPLVLADTTLDKAKLKPACRYHMWVFHPGSQPFLEVGLPGTWKRVTHTISCFKYTQPYQNVMFVLHPGDFVLKEGIKNCCFPCYLAEDAPAAWKAEFDMKQLSTAMALPAGFVQGETPVAVGLGVTVDSTVDTLGIFKTPVRLRVNGVEVTLTSL